MPVEGDQNVVRLAGRLRMALGELGEAGGGQARDHRGDDEGPGREMAGLARDPPDLSALYATYVWAALGFVFFAASMGLAYWRSEDPLVRQRVKVLLPSVTIGGALSVFALINNAFSGGDFPLQLGLVIVPVFYASLA